MIEHLKGHENQWSRFFDGIEYKLNNKYNRKNMIYDDERIENDLKLSNGLLFKDKSVFIRFPNNLWLMIELGKHLKRFLSGN